MDNANVHGVDEMIKRLNQAKLYIKEDVPEVIGTEAVRHFKKGFADEGFTDKSLKKWASRKTKVTHGRGPLRGGDAEGLEDSIVFKVEGNTITIYSDKVYGQIHNEGGTIEVTPGMKAHFWKEYYAAKETGEAELMEQWKAMALAKKITIPQRQFIGESQVLIETITAKVLRDLTQILNS